MVGASIGRPDRCSAAHSTTCNDRDAADTVSGRVIARGTGQLGDLDFPHEQDQIVRTKVARFEPSSAARVTDLVDADGAIISTDAGTDSHGVSDPSGQAQGH